MDVIRGSSMWISCCTASGIAKNTKVLQVHAWVMMGKLCRLISSTSVPLSDIIRDLKKFTAKKIMAAIQENEGESRKSWLLQLLTKDGVFWF